MCLQSLEGIGSFFDPCSLKLTQFAKIGTKTIFCGYGLIWWKIVVGCGNGTVLSKSSCRFWSYEE